MNEVQFATLPTRKIFFRCALPGLLAMVVSSIYMMIDGIFVGRYIGSHALAAVNLAFPVIMILFAVGDMVAVGSSVKIALLLGQRKNKEANGLFSAAFCMILGIGVLFSLVGFLAAPRLITLLIKDTTGTTQGSSFISCLPSCPCSPLTTICGSAAKPISACG